LGGRLALVGLGGSGCFAIPAFFLGSVC
jgi:hypothetical protein